MHIKRGTADLKHTGVCWARLQMQCQVLIGMPLWRSPGGCCIAAVGLARGRVDPGHNVQDVHLHHDLRVMSEILSVVPQDADSRRCSTASAECFSIDWPLNKPQASRGGIMQALWQLQPDAILDQQCLMAKGTLSCSAE